LLIFSEEVRGCVAVCERIFVLFTVLKGFRQQLSIFIVVFDECTVKIALNIFPKHTVISSDVSFSLKSSDTQLTLTYDEGKYHIF